MLKDLQFYLKQQVIRLKPKDDREIKREKFKKIKENLIK